MDQTYLKKYQNIVGCDEVGRGPIAGPVNACAVKISTQKLIKMFKDLNVTDSKALSLKKRKLILHTLKIDPLKIKLGKVYKTSYEGEIFEYCVEEISPEDIDHLNILQASLLAMKKASEKLANQDSLILIDGNKIFESRFKNECVIKGDAKVVAIALASIIAKVFRDEKMMKFDVLYPGYNLKKNAGYPTKEHRDAVAKIGISPIHRKSFKGVKEFIQG